LFRVRRECPWCTCLTLLVVCGLSCVLRCRMDSDYEEMHHGDIDDKALAREAVIASAGADMFPQDRWASLPPFPATHEDAHSESDVHVDVPAAPTSGTVKIVNPLAGRGKFVRDPETGRLVFETVVDGNVMHKVSTYHMWFFACGTPRWVGSHFAAAQQRTVGAHLARLWLVLSLHRLLAHPTHPHQWARRHAAQVAVDHSPAPPTPPQLQQLRRSPLQPGVIQGRRAQAVVHGAALQHWQHQSCRWGPTETCWRCWVTHGHWQCWCGSKPASTLCLSTTTRRCKRRHSS